jgi:acyl-CoA thioester hydrolase
MILPFDVELSVRYRDMDTFGHVNNAVYATYLEQARYRYFDRVLDVPYDEREMVLANVEIDFRRPLALSDRTVRIACGVVELGRSSFRMRYRVFPGDWDDPAATAEAVLVAVEDGQPRPIPSRWRERFVEFEPGLESDGPPTR